MKAFRDERQWTQGRLADAIGVSQGHVSQLELANEGTRGIGLPALIALRNYLVKIGRPMTLDDLLGLDAFAAPPTTADVPAEMKRLTLAVEQLLQAHAEPPPTPPHAPPRLLPPRRPKET